MARKTVKDLNKDFEHMFDKFETLRRIFQEQLNVLKMDHEEKIKVLEDKVATLEQ